MAMAELKELLSPEDNPATATTVGCENTLRRAAGKIQGGPPFLPARIMMEDAGDSGTTK